MRTIRQPNGEIARILETVEDHMVIERERGAMDTPELRAFIKESVDWEKEYVFHGWEAEKIMTIREKVH